MENTPEKFAHIKGWGIDADPKNDPTYPMKNRMDLEQSGYSWDRPTQQPETVEILHSNERPNISAVFGTPNPPSGLSGIIRRFAFNYSENEYLHWLPLLLADRINAVEGVISDLSKGHVPNIFAEKGYKGKWQHDQKGVIGRLAATALVTAGVVMLFSGNGKKKKKKRYTL